MSGVSSNPVRVVAPRVVIYGRSWSLRRAATPLALNYRQGGISLFDTAACLEECPHLGLVSFKSKRERSLSVVSLRIDISRVLQ